MDLILHRARFVQRSPSGIAASAIHPDGAYIAVLRGTGDIELWLTEGKAPVSLSAAANDSGLAGAGWSVAATIPGTAGIPLQCICWVPVKSRTIPGLDGCRLFVGSLNGAIYEADWLARRLRHAADSNAGSVWSLASASLAKFSGVAGAGALLSAGCEDGSVRILRVETHETGCEHVVACPGAEGRVLSIAWHPKAPVLFAGTATGAARGYDLTSVAQGVVSSYETEQAARSAAAAARARARAATVSTKSSGAAAASKAKGRPRIGGAAAVDVGSDSEADSDDEDEAMDGAVAGSGRGATVGPAPVVHFKVDPHALGKKGKGEASCIWSLAVASDMTVITADSSGSVQAWDGRMGVLASSVPLVRHTGDVLSLAMVEEGGASAASSDADNSSAASAPSRILIASGGVDGRVVVVSSVPSTSSTSSSGSPRSWVQLGAHAVHGAPVRTVALCARGGLKDGAWVASGGADGFVTSVRLSDLAATNGGMQPRRTGPLAGHTGLVAAAGGAGLLASYHASCVQLWSLKGKTIGQGKASEPALAVQIDTPSVQGSASAAPDAVAVPLAQPAALALSEDGHWLAYASASDDVPKLVYLTHTPQAGHGQAGTEVTAVQHVRWSTEESLRAALSAAAARVSGGRGAESYGLSSQSAGAPSRMQFVQAGSVTLLVAVACGRLFVHVCSAGIVNGAASVRPEAAFAYSLPIPAAHSDAVRVASAGPALALLTAHGAVAESPVATGGASASAIAPAAASAPVGRKRSATVDSAGLASEGGYGASADGEESQGEGTTTADDGRSAGALQPAATTNVLCLPLVLSTSSSSDGPALACVATSTRHAHVYILGPRHGELQLTLPRLHAIPAAAAFTPGGQAVLVACRDAAVLAYAPSSGLLLPWSPARPGTKASGADGSASGPAPGSAPTLPRLYQGRLKADPTLRLVPLTVPALAAGGHLEAGSSFKILVAGHGTVAALTINASVGAAAAAPAKPASGSKAKDSSSEAVAPVYSCTSAISDGYENVLVAGLACPTSRLGKAQAVGAQVAGVAAAVSPAQPAASRKRGRNESAPASKPAAPAPAGQPAEVVVVDVPYRHIAAALGLGPASKAAAAGGEDVTSATATLARLGQGMRGRAKYGRG